MVALLCVLLAVGADDDVKSGPEKGAKVPALKVYDVTGENKEKTIDYAAERKDKVTVYLIVGEKKFDRPMHQFIKALDDKIVSDYDGVYGVAVFLTEDEDDTKKFLGRVQTSVNYGKTALTVFKGKDGPKDWNINTDAHLTVILAKGGKVMARFAYKSVNDTEVPAVEKELKKLVKK